VALQNVRAVYRAFCVKLLTRIEHAYRRLETVRGK
jgi:hypothetical protein